MTENPYEEWDYKLIFAALNNDIKLVSDCINKHAATPARKIILDRRRVCALDFAVRHENAGMIIILQNAGADRTKKADNVLQRKAPKYWQQRESARELALSYSDQGMGYD